MDFTYVAMYVFQNFCLGVGFGAGLAVAYGVAKKVGVVG